MLSFFPRDVLDRILDLIESVSKGFSYPLLQHLYLKEEGVDEIVRIT